MKKREAPDYKDYPDNVVSIRVGNKVGWRTYKDRKDADKCAEAARHNARIQEGLGYDFGYQCPGEVRTVEAGFEVTIP